MQDGDPSLACVVSEANLTLELDVNNSPRTCIIDTGSAYSLCSATCAMALGLRVGLEERMFTGLGSGTGKAALPVQVRIGGVSKPVIFWVVEGLSVPLLIGLADLAAFDVLIDPRARTMTLKRQKIDSAVVASSELMRKRAKRADTTTGIDETLPDEALLQEARILFSKRSSNLDEQRREAVWQLIANHSQCWLRPRVGHVKCMKASFTVTGRPVKAKLRHLEPQLKEELEKHLTSMLAAGVIRPSKSPWGASPVFVRKKDNSWRMALDYRPVNKQMVADAYPIPLIWENLQMAAHHEYYTTLDCNWGFWNVPLEEESMQYTAIVTHKGTFEYTVLPFGIKNSPGEFQRAMDKIFGDLYNEGVLCYIDDIVIFADTLEKHDGLLREVLCRCVEGGLYLKLMKCSFCDSEVELLGHRVGTMGIGPSPKKVEAIRKATPPTDKKVLRSFLGTAGYLRRFIPYFSDYTAPLVALLKKGAAWSWGETQQQGFEGLVDAVSDLVLLNAPKGGRMHIYCDASDVALPCGASERIISDRQLISYGIVATYPGVSVFTMS